MALKATYESEDDIPDGFSELYTERDGKWELTGVEGMKTEADVARVQSSLTKERAAHKTTKEKLRVWGDLDPDEVQTNLDRIPELEAQVEAGGGKPDEEKIATLVEKRVARETAGLTRKVDQLTKDNAEKEEQIGVFRGRENGRLVEDAVREVWSQVREEAQGDVIMWARAQLVVEPGEDGAPGKVVTKEGSGMPEGLDAKAWLDEVLPKKPHWLKPSGGTGANGAGDPTAPGGPNPWKSDTWSITKQAEIRKADPKRAERLAKNAGVDVNALEPKRENGSPPAGLPRMY